MKKTTEEWLDHAKADLLNCELIINQHALSNILAFHSQQAVEKTFKALMEEIGLTIPKVHNLQRLYSIIEQYFAEKIDLTELALLDTIYTSSRYPGELGLFSTGKPNYQEALEIFNTAKRIVEITVRSIEEFNKQ